MSAETDALIAWMRGSGVPFRVTDINTPGIHAATSWHYAAGTGGTSLAVDFAGRTPSTSSPQLLAIYEALLPLAPFALELFYGGPGGALWKRGRKIQSLSIQQAHRNHVHIAIPKGWRYTKQEAPPVMPTESDPDIKAPVTFHPIVAHDGTLRGYIIYSQANGDIHVWGDPAFVKFWGKSDVVA